ncbi:MAG: zf-HC2 domain-containing protein [Anaerolineales bacterium]|nr:zf-HC2 domain-containing protein [Anaerolineales bacterium]
MDCETLLAYLSDYIDRNLSEDLSQAAQDHLRTCQNCRIVLDSTQRTILLARQHTQTVIPAERRQHLFEQIQSAFEKRL